MASQSLLVAFLSVVVLLVEGGLVPLMSPPADNKIIRGDEIDISKVPWQVSIIYDSKQHCGGSIISKDWIVTAAHCTFKRDLPRFTLRVGSNTYMSGGEEYKVAHIVNHPGFNYTEGVVLTNDISLVKTSKSIKLNCVDTKAVQLQMPGVAPPQVHTAVTVSGWGFYGSDRILSPKLKAAQVDVINFSICEQKYTPFKFHESNQFCAQEKTGNDCKGDSGGPVTVGDVLLGIVSAGDEFCGGGGPSIYTTVTVFREWIKDVTGV